MKKNTAILIGTNNKGKFKELSYLLPKKLKKISPKKFKIKSPKENGKSFLSNSIIKANYFCKISKFPSLSDDSGLCVSCLKGKPGIHSARWAKKHGGFYKAMKKIIKLVSDKNKNSKTKNYRAKFVCSLTYKEPNKAVISSTGIIYGKISKKILGKKGFGYDSIFIPNNYKLTFGQMSPKNKIFIDHRFIAYKKIKKKIKIL